MRKRDATNADGKADDAMLREATHLKMPSQANLFLILNIYLRGNNQHNF